MGLWPVEGTLRGSRAVSHHERMDPLPHCVVHRPGETWQLAVLVKCPLFWRSEGWRGLYPRCPKQDENKRSAGPCVCNSAKPVHSLGGRHAGRERALSVSYRPDLSDGSQSPGWACGRFSGVLD